MYIQITTRCNMTCAHCCYSCTAQGEDMSMEVFLAAIDIVENEIGGDIAIGGGEPTLHPDFWKFLGLSSLSCEEGPVWLATNGSITKDALRLARLAKKGTISCELSQDEYHDAIDGEVIQAFMNISSSRYGGGNPNIRDVGEHVKAQGRGTEISDDEGCCCESIVASPDGKLWACGCKTHQLGTVFSHEIPEDWEGAFKVAHGECPNHGEKY